MKLLLKLFLVVFLMAAGIYLASPLWLSFVLARQLPAGWQLDELKSSYPGLEGIDIDLLRVRADLGFASLSLTSSDLRVEYRDLKSDIGLIVLDVHMHPSQMLSEGSLSPDDLSLPVARIAALLPQLSIGKMRVALHRAIDLPDASTRPMLLDFETFDLSPRSGPDYHLSSRVTIEESSQFSGQLDVDVSPDLVNAAMRFPVGADLTPWLTLDFAQEQLATETTTRIQAVLDADSANREWLDALLAGGSGHVFTQLGGKLEMVANFAGQEQQAIENLSLTSQNLRLISSGGALDLNADIEANREGEDIAIDLQKPLTVHYEGKTTWISDLFRQIIPELQLTPAPEAKVSTVLGAGGRFLYHSGNGPSARFIGDIRIDLTSATETMALQSSGIRIQVDDLQKPDSTSAEGLIAFAWQVSAPLTYATEDLRMDAKNLSMTAEVLTGDGKLVSKKGSGTLGQVHLAAQDVSAKTVDVSWQDLDLAAMTGKFETRTLGFSTNIDEELWTGFDFDIQYVLPGKDNIDGAGIVKFANGQEFPIEFTGNTATRHWDIKLLPVSIQLVKLRKLLAVAHYPLPESIKLTDGSIELQGDVQVGDEITARMLVSGHEAGASMLESSARQTRFTFNTGYDTSPWASGPITIETIALAGGIDVTGVSSEFELENTGTIALRNLDAEVFDGRLKLATVEFLDNEIEDTTIELSHINLGLLLAFADIDGLAGTGYIDISLPIGSDKTGLHVRDGVFSSTEPGRLAYTREGVAGSNIGLQALENFQYKSLSGTLNYQSDGNYVITIRLEGKNPDLYGGHPVVFNLNVNGLLPELFESMFLTGSFEESILKQIKSR